MGHDTNSESESILSESNDLAKDVDVAAKIKRDEKPHKCTFDGCNLSFSRPSRLKKHMKFHTGERDYKCTYADCDKAYTSNSHLKRHMESHNAVKKLYKCPECSLHISNQHNLKRHYNTMHTNHDKLTCKECNETFVKKYQFKIHMAEHNSVLYKCDECNKSFKNITKFKRHKAYHEEGGKQYPCSMPGCNEVFKKWLLLCAHKKTQHVNDYKCNNCGKIFLSKRHLKIHSQTHMENRSVVSCPFEKCPRVYYFKSNLTHHIRTYHLGEKYECDICKIKIGSKQRLATHIQKLHMSEKKIKEIKKRLRKKRKDAGVVKKSALSKLVGIKLPAKVEKIVLKGEETIPYLEQFETESNCNADCNYLSSIT
ncbi:zinc finger protein 431-like [Bombus vosnesenskii]|uniref:Zinc finger protein 431-like n=1 Tax=Bombus vosnesenskii TaxID=207650 RepID=A0A6J3K7B0_9HYME|nr:zinc finger protein 431-like [Bombus vosnesenskii]XP_033348983.1 zinc finger protein 431-like [Bombus vosnesenskii]XP_033348985.1 zinc finger protein 431-like [Bombus vosnesenskii]XP_033348986.1 zinc finger protein 431-like [Bombus vosnesenskii]